MGTYVHFRRSVFAGLYVLAGTALGWFWLYRREFFWAALFIASLSLFLVWLISLRNESLKRTVFALLLLVVAASAGFLRLYFEKSAHDSLPEKLEGQFTARVYEKTADLITLDQIVLDGQACAGQAAMYPDDDTERLELGDRITFTGKLSREKLGGETKGMLNVSGYIRGIRYRARVTGSPGGIKRVPGKAPPIPAVRKYLRDGLSAAMGDQRAYSVGIALLIGDTSEMDELDYSAFRELGVLHIFAVSGMHFAILFLIVRKLSSKAKWLKWVIFPVLLFYAAICGFSPSVLRSFIMITVMLVGMIVRKNYDVLSSLFFSALLIAMIQPYHIFSAGFSLSFAGVCGIVFLTPLFEKLFKRLPRKINTLLSVSLGAQIALVPVISFWFGKFYTLSILVNALLSPVVSLAYGTLFFMTMFLLPIRWMRFAFQAPKFLLNIMLWLARAIENLPTSIFFYVGIDVVFFAACLIFVASKYVNLKWLGKIVLCGLLSMLFLNVQISSMFVRLENRLSFSVFGALYRSNTETVFLSSGRGEPYDLKLWFRQKRIRRIDAYYILNSQSALDELEELTKETSVRELFFCDTFSGEESGLLLYANKRYGAKGTLLVPGESRSHGKISVFYPAAGVIAASAEGFRFSAFARKELEIIARTAQKNSLYYTYSCQKWQGVRVVCADCDGIHKDNTLDGELLFGLKYGTIFPVNF